jgi:aarF domain-containing kinase
MAFHRISSLPFALRLSVLSSPQASCTIRSSALRIHWKHPQKSTYSTHSLPPPRRFTFPRRALWVIPIAGSLTFYFLPHPSTHIPSLFTSPTIIPCSTQPTSKRNLISSPSEPRQSILSRILLLLCQRIWEPIRTATRFIHLTVLFVPVIVMMPMLLVGAPEAKLQGDRWGAVWWYGLLVARMEAAGPTFIKVRSSLPFDHCEFNEYL